MQSKQYAMKENAHIFKFKQDIRRTVFSGGIMWSRNCIFKNQFLFNQFRKIEQCLIYLFFFRSAVFSMLGIFYAGYK